MKVLTFSKSDWTTSVVGARRVLGELYSTLASEGWLFRMVCRHSGRYRDALLQRGIADELHQLLDGLDNARSSGCCHSAKPRNHLQAMERTPRKMWRRIGSLNGSPGWRRCRRAKFCDAKIATRVLPPAESFLNVAAQGLFEACALLASIFTDRAISTASTRLRSLQGRALRRRDENGAIGYRRQRCHLHTDTESDFATGLRHGCYGSANHRPGPGRSDEFYVHKPTLAQAFAACCGVGSGPTNTNDLRQAAAAMRAAGTCPWSGEFLHFDGGRDLADFAVRMRRIIKMPADAMDIDGPRRLRGSSFIQARRTVLAVRRVYGLRV